MPTDLGGMRFRGAAPMPLTKTCLFGGVGGRGNISAICDPRASCSKYSGACGNSSPPQHVLHTLSRSLLLPVPPLAACRLRVYARAGTKQAAAPPVARGLVP
ncbi:hypothetical protein B0H19DRAFT_1253202 [Mycena capillaripes]|nr:hypothetical protein B0H19DRAFT_1253202 [Mycena capillaripes]